MILPLEPYLELGYKEMFCLRPAGRFTGNGRNATILVHFGRQCVQICLLASGSKGNAVFVRSGATRLLIDAGLSSVEIVRRLALIGENGSDLNAILVSHDHTDHIKGVGTLGRKLKIPVLVSYPTHKAAESTFRKAEVVEFESGYSFEFRDLMIEPFPTTHDACDPVGFTIESSEGRFGFATDFGIVTRLVVEKLKGCRALVIEANHDEEMLQNGPYPWHLKQRIKSRHGHISNNESSQLLGELLHEGLEGVFLAHLSEVNNDPRLAEGAAATLLAGQNVCAPRLFVGDQYRPSEMLDI